MAGDIPDIDPGDGGRVDETRRPKGAPEQPVKTGEACLSCGAEIFGVYCFSCGQKNDDMRRSTFALFRDFIEDTFAFDSRMWMTLGLMAAKPGFVPTNYSHGRRSRYTPPVRLFLVVSFLFFLVLGLTNTMFIAMEVKAKSPEKIAQERADLEETMKNLDEETRAKIKAAQAEDGAFVIEGQDIDCYIDVSARFFVRPQDVTVDLEKWRACRSTITTAAKVEIDRPDAEVVSTGGEPLTKEEVKEGFDRVVGGIDTLVENPASFNASINTWLPRVMFFMAPVLALILAMFIRGKDALLFDHAVLSLYSHAVGFAVMGFAIVFAQFGAPQVFPVAVVVLAIYFVAAIKRAYGRGWAKTLYTATLASVLYFIVLVSIVGSIIANRIWSGA